MYTREEMEIMNLADSYTLLYSFLAGPLLAQFGVEGERALREGTRKFGRDRAESLRERHLKANVKINMHSLFAVGPDLPPDPRFRRELQTLNAQERYLIRCFALWLIFGSDMAYLNLEGFIVKSFIMLVIVIMHMAIQR